MTDQVLIRAFPTSLERTGPRTITGRLVPYNSPAQVMDTKPNGDPDIYTEGFRPGVFGRQSRSNEPGVARRIRLVHSHQGGLGYLGPFTALREEDDGLWGDAEVLRSKSGDVEDLLAAGVRELSVEFRLAARGSTETDADGIRWRTHAHLDAVALEPKGAYTGAEVMAFRAELDEADKERAQVLEQEAIEAQHRADAEAAQAAKLQADKAALEANARAAADRRARWDALTGRFDAESKRQQLYITEYGLTLPTHAYPQHGY